MRNCRTNTYKLWYVNCLEQQPLLDENGDSTGEFIDSYSPPTFFRANISPSRGEAWEAPYGLNLQYENVLATADMDLHIDETTYIFESEPEVADDGTVDISAAVYKVVAVAKGHMHMRYALRKIRHEGGHAWQE